MNGRHRPDPPDDDPATQPPFHPAPHAPPGRSDPPRPSRQAPPGRGGPPPLGYGRQVPLGSGASGSPPDNDADDETPQWYVPQQPAQRRPPRGAEHFTGASEPGGPSPSRTPGQHSAAPRSTDGSYESELGYEHGPRRRRQGVLRTVGPMAGAAALALLAGVGVFALAQSRGGCASDDTIQLSVAVSPDLAAAISKTAARFNDAGHKVDGRCVQATVRPSDSASMTTMLTGQTSATNLTRPDVWIPDSSRWLALIRASAKGKNAVQQTRTSMAHNPVVIAMPQTLAAGLRRQGTPAQPSWSDLLSAAAGGQASGPIPAGSVRLYAPDPTRTGTGLVTLLITSTLLADDPEREARFTGIVRTVRENVRPTVEAEFALFTKNQAGRAPIALVPEQAVWKHNRSDPAERAVAVYPREGTLSLDYPVVLTAGDSSQRQAAQLLEKALAGEDAQEDVRALGFRSADGQAPDGYGTAGGVNPARPAALPAPSDPQVTTAMQSWLKLSLGIRMLALFDISGSMDEKVAADVTRMQATIRVAQSGVSLFPDDTELGIWVFSTKLQGNQDWRELVPVDRLGDRAGSITHRQQVLRTLAGVRAKENGDTGLYESVLAAYRHMTETYKPEFANSIMLLSDGKNDDPGGPSLRKTLADLRAIRDDNRPVQVIMIGWGGGVDTDELEQIADATGGSVHVAYKSEDVQQIFLRAVSRRTQN